MADIFQTFTIKAPPQKVFEGISTSEGLDQWWTKNSEADQRIDGKYLLDFGPGYTWKAAVSKYDPNREFELLMTDADADWDGSKVGFFIEDKNGSSEVNFYHTGWPENNKHYKISTYCWAMYLRILKRYMEFGEKVPYEKRLSV